MSVLERYERALQIALRDYPVEHPEVTQIVNILEAIEREEGISHVRARTMGPINSVEEIRLLRNGKSSWMAACLLKGKKERFGFGSDPTEALQDLLGRIKGGRS